MSLDISAILLAGLVNTLVGTAVLWALWRRVRQRFDGLGFWVADFVMLAAGLVLMSLRGVVPDLLSMVASNTLIVGASVAGYEGLQRFVGRRSSQLPNLVLLGAFAAVHTWFALIQPDLRLRSLNLSVALVLVCGQCAWLLLRGAGPPVRS